MPVINDYIETRRKTVSICLDYRLHCGLKSTLGRVDSHALRNLLARYLNKEYPKGSKPLPDDPDSFIGNKVVCVSMNLSSYEVYKACADQMRKPVSAILRASLREVCLDVQNPYREILLGLARKQRG